MLQLTIVVPEALAGVVLERLRHDPGVVTLALHPGAAIEPSGALLVCTVVPERADAVIDELRAVGVERLGAIAIERLDALVSYRAHRAEQALAGTGGTSLPWAVIESTARDSAEPSATFYVLMAIASLIAAVGIMVDSSVLIIGAMIVGPEFGPLSAVAVGLYRRRVALLRRGGGTLVSGLAVAVGASALAAIVARGLGEPVESFDPAGRFFTDFVTRPNVFSAVIALAAGVAGMIALGQVRSTALSGVLVSVTTIPAAAAIGVDASVGAWHDLGLAAVQLGINLASLIVGALGCLAVFDRTRTATIQQRPLP